MLAAAGRPRPVPTLCIVWLRSMPFTPRCRARCPPLSCPPPLQHLIASGDRIDRIEGIFSGTLSYIFNTFGTGA